MNTNKDKIHLKKMETREGCLAEAASLYNLVWNKEDQSFLERLMRHGSYDGFQGEMAFEGDARLAGFVYGYNSQKGQYYRGLIEKELSEEEALTWLEDCFEVVELAVHPESRKQGIGRLLEQRILAQLPNKTAILTTQKDNIAARQLYWSLGWTTIKESFFPDQTGTAYVIMGKRLSHNKSPIGGGSVHD
ncbi:GNAT family N-acetyltransferase [Bacillus infantis]|uniref:GNAT family N-acetyltransferase n=1 Tax=Bacillus infantis TaxID=324767 RepID=A0A5D4RQN1_9BACI|nr:N-acetyltransferase [Bacillus infantis]TYS52024.1 GNAT family N-acetyltransferase [Bacillus infantis]